MKNLIVSAFMLAALATSAHAQNVHPANAAPATAPAATSADANAKTKVEPAALPAAVKTTLETAEYKDWKVAEAWLVKTPSEYYSLQLKKDDKAVTLNLGKDGKVIKS